MISEVEDLFRNLIVVNKKAQVLRLHGESGSVQKYAMSH